MATLQALIFDVDGTLAETERDGHRVAFNRAFEDYALPWHWEVEEYGALLKITGGKERIRDYIDRFQPDFVPPEPLDTFIAKLHKAKGEHFARIVATGAMPLRPGIKRIIEEARDQGVRLAIATTTSPENVYAILKKGLGDDAVAWFEVIAAGDIVSKKKPSPDIYRYALEQLNLPASACLAIEDSENGLRSALGANLRTLITVSIYCQHDAFDGASLVVNHLGDSEHPTIFYNGHLPTRYPWMDLPSLKAAYG